MLAPILAVVACAAAAPGDRPFADFHGWTRDGRYAAWTIVEYSVNPESGDETRRVTGYVADTFTGDVKEEKALEKWIAAHPLEKRAARTSPDGKAKARVDLTGEDGAGSWKENTFHFGCPNADPCMMSSGRMRFAVERGGKVLAAGGWQEDSAGNLHGTVTPHWSPDGRRVAWVLLRGYAMLNDFGYGRVSITAAVPGVEVLAPKGFDARALEATTAALEKSGLACMKRGAAQKAREKSAVYHAGGFEAEARAAAAAIPGGATVEKLTWKSDAALVVALGASAAK